MSIDSTNEGRKKKVRQTKMQVHANLGNSGSYRGNCRLGVKVPIRSSVYGYTKVLAHSLNSKNTFRCCYWLKMNAELLQCFCRNKIFRGHS